MDVMVVQGVITNLFPPVNVLRPGASSEGTVAACAPGPSFVDVSTATLASVGTCPNVAGTGTFTSVGCTSGLLTGSLAVTEPDGDVVPVTFTAVVVNGVGTVAASYPDDGGTGEAVGAMTMLPEPVTACTPASGVTVFGLQMVLAAAYVH